MPSNIERRKREAVQGVLLFGLLQLIVALGFAALCFIPDLPLWTVILFGALAVFCIIPFILAVAALKQRFQEIEGGELDAAAQY